MAGILNSSAAGYTELNPFAAIAGEKRILYFMGEVNEVSVNEMIAKIIYLDYQSHDPITMLIASNGGSIVSGMALYDVMQTVESPIRTVAVGNAYSMGAILLAGGENGERYAFEHSKIMIHEPLISQGAGGSVSSIKSLCESLSDSKRMLDGIIAKHTGKTIKTVEKNTSYDHYFSAKEAVEFGLIDKIIKKGDLI